MSPSVTVASSASVIPGIPAPASPSAGTATADTFGQALDSAVEEQTNPTTTPSRDGGSDTQGATDSQGEPMTPTALIATVPTSSKPNTPVAATFVTPQMPKGSTSSTVESEDPVPVAVPVQAEQDSTRPSPPPRADLDTANVTEQDAGDVKTPPASVPVAVQVATEAKSDAVPTVTAVPSKATSSLVPKAHHSKDAPPKSVTPEPTVPAVNLPQPPAATPAVEQVSSSAADSAAPLAVAASVARPALEPANATTPVVTASSQVAAPTTPSSSSATRDGESGGGAPSQDSRARADSFAMPSNSASTSAPVAPALPASPHAHVASVAAPQPPVPPTVSLVNATQATAAPQGVSGQATGSQTVPLQQQLAQPILRLATGADGQQTIQVKVAPDDLGPVTVQASVSGGSVHIELFAPTDAGREALKQILPDLRGDLNSATNRGSLTVSDQGAPDTDSNQQTHQKWDSPQDGGRRSQSDAGQDARPVNQQPRSSLHRLDVLA